LKCTNCQRLGHTKEKCTNSKEENKQQVNTVKVPFAATHVTFEKPVLINDKYVLRGLVDSGSVCIIKRKSAAEVCQLQVRESNLELVGFGSEGVGTKILGTSTAKLAIDGVDVEVSLIIANDSSLSHDLLIVESFLCHELVAFIKLGDKLIIGRADQKPFLGLLICLLVTRIN
jgi:hypothetical protein